jgi:hypothetical protein
MGKEKPLKEREKKKTHYFTWEERGFRKGLILPL